MFSRCCNAACAVMLSFGVSACATPLSKVVSSDAPGYRVKQPALGDGQLGRRLIGEQPETNMCFAGDIVEDELSSWTGRTLNYTSSLDADIATDFGQTVEASAAVGTESAINIMLKDVAAVQLQSLFFNAEGPCATDNTRAEYLGGKDETVLTRALKAGSIEISKDAQGNASLTVAVDRVGGSAAAETSSTASWSGTNLFFADYPEKVRVTRQDAPRQQIAVNQTVDLGNCGFTLTAIQSQWQGRLSCQGGHQELLQGAVGDYVSTRIAPGVSYAIRLTQAGVAQGLISMHRYNVVSVR